MLLLWSQATLSADAAKRGLEAAVAGCEEEHERQRFCLIMKLNQALGDLRISIFMCSLAVSELDREEISPIRKLSQDVVTPLTTYPAICTTSHSALARCDIFGPSGGAAHIFGPRSGVVHCHRSQAAP